MLNVSYKPSTLAVAVIMLSVIVLSVVAPSKVTFGLRAYVRFGQIGGDSQEPVYDIGSR
jgi:hypothetical protein